MNWIFADRLWCEYTRKITSVLLGAQRVGFTRGRLGWLGRAEEFEALLWGGNVHFVTFSCYGRIPLLRTVGARNVYVEALGIIRDRYKFSLVGYVVMPEHVHLLFSEPPKSTPSIVLKVLKQRVARDLRTKERETRNDRLNLSFMTGDAGLLRFWQARFHDFNVYSRYKVREKLEYMHENPVKRDW